MFANTLRLRSVTTKTIASLPTTVLKDFTTQKSTRPNFVLSNLAFVNTSSSAHLLTLTMISKRDFYMRCLEMQISTCTTSRLNGVLSWRTIINLNVFMPTTGMISVVNPTFSTTIPVNFAKIGSQVLSLVTTMKGARYRLTVPRARDGRSKPSTLSITKSIPAKTETVLKVCNAATIIQAKVISDSLIQSLMSMIQALSMLVSQSSLRDKN